MVEFLDSEYKVKDAIIRCIESAEDETGIILITEILPIDENYKSSIETMAKRKIPTTIVYKGGYSQNEVNKEIEYFKRLDQKYIGLCASDDKFRYNIYMNKNVIIFTSLGLKSFYGNIHCGVKLDRNIDNKIYEDMRYFIERMIKNGKVDFGHIGNIGIKKEIEKLSTLTYINQEPNKNDEFFSLLRGINNSVITDALNHNHICAIWMTTKKYEDISGFKGIWNHISEDIRIPYPLKTVLDRFREHISGRANEEDIKYLKGKIPIMLIKLDDTGNICDDIIITLPEDFDTGDYKGTPHLYFKRGKVLHKIMMSELNKEGLKWIERYNRRLFSEFINFFYENKKK